MCLVIGSVANASIVVQRQVINKQATVAFGLARDELREEFSDFLQEMSPTQTAAQ